MSLFAFSTSCCRRLRCCVCGSESHMLEGLVPILHAMARHAHLFVLRRAISSVHWHHQPNSVCSISHSNARMLMVSSRVGSGSTAPHSGRNSFFTTDFSSAFCWLFAPQAAQFRVTSRANHREKINPNSQVHRFEEGMFGRGKITCKVNRGRTRMSTFLP